MATQGSSDHNSHTRSVIIFFQVFQNSGFKRTLCGGKWQSLYSNSYLTSTGRLGCCPAGQFMASSTSTVCEACPVGQYGSTVDDDITSCNDCGIGKYNEQVGQSSESIACQNCGTGQYNEQIGQSLCQGYCGAGKFSILTGQTNASSCISCPSGDYSNAGASSCPYTATTCPMGTYASGTAACNSCGVGKYNEQSGQSGQTACKDCAAGKSQPLTGQTSALSCKERLPNGDGASSATGNTGTLRRAVSDWIAGGTLKSTVVATYGLIEDWDVSEVTYMKYVFYGGCSGCSGTFGSFNADLSKWNTGAVTNMEDSKRISLSHTVATPFRCCVFEYDIFI